MFLVTTNSVSPFAIGRWTDGIGVVKHSSNLPFTRTDPLHRQIDPSGKLDGHFNNLNQFPTPYSQDPNGLDWPYFDRLSDDSLSVESDGDSSLLQKLKKNFGSASTEGTFIENYKNNLTKGFIDDSVFGRPEVILKS